MNCKAKDIVSPSRTYVAICCKSDFSGHYFRKFTLPEVCEELAAAFILDNNGETAQWFFLNRVDLVACIEGVFSFEDFLAVSFVK